MVGRQYIVFFVLAVLCSGCMASFPPCVREHAKQQIIQWGEIHGDGSLSGYQVTANAELSAFQQQAFGSVAQLQPKGRVDNDMYCDRLTLVRRAFLDVQALNVPGTTRKFVAFLNPNNGLELRAIWNPEYDTKGNEQFRAVFDSLEALRQSVE